MLTYADACFNAVLVANEISARRLLRHSHLTRLTPTHDLNAFQLGELATALGPRVSSQLEAIIHQHLPIFHTEHCVCFFFYCFTAALLLLY